jgi:hypothetical protein
MWTLASAIAYRGRGVSNLHPADAVLNLPAEKHSHGIRRLAADYDPPGISTDARGVFDDGRLRAAGVKDPDGNTIAITRTIEVAAQLTSRKSTSVEEPGSLEV